MSIARHAVVPCTPTELSPISSKTSPTLSPTSGVGAKDKSIIPNSAPNSFAASLPTNSPILEILNAVFFIVSLKVEQSAPLIFSIAALTTPGPEIPTLITQSPSEIPLKEPAINGLSSTAFANITSLAQPIHDLSAVAWAVLFTTSPIKRTASILIPAFVEPTLTLAHTTSVSANTFGIVLMNSSSCFVIPFWTIAVYPPMKLTLHSFAALSIARAIFSYPPLDAPIKLIGLTDNLLLIIGIPYFDWILSTIVTKSFALSVSLVYTLSAVVSALSEIQSKRDICIVTVLMSRCKSLIIVIVWTISLWFNISHLLNSVHWIEYIFVLNSNFYVEFFCNNI